jgi:hypothetical protein
VFVEFPAANCILRFTFAVFLFVRSNGLVFSGVSVLCEQYQFNHLTFLRIGRTIKEIN